MDTYCLRLGWAGLGCADPCRGPPWEAPEQRPCVGRAWGRGGAGSRAQVPGQDGPGSAGGSSSDKECSCTQGEGKSVPRNDTADVRALKKHVPGCVVARSREEMGATREDGDSSDRSQGGRRRRLIPERMKRN